MRRLQGAVVLLGGHMMDRHISYVAASRSKGVTHLVADHAEIGKNSTAPPVISASILGPPVGCTLAFTLTPEP